MNYWLPEVQVPPTDTTIFEEYIANLYSQKTDFLGFTLKKEEFDDKVEHCLYNVYLNDKLIASHLSQSDVMDLFAHTIGFSIAKIMCTAAPDETDADAAQKKYDEDLKKEENRVFFERLRILGSID